MLTRRVIRTGLPGGELNSRLRLPRVLFSFCLALRCRPGVAVLLDHSAEFLEILFPELECIDALRDKTFGRRLELISRSVRAA
jgi:hypothetical protein